MRGVFGRTNEAVAPVWHEHADGSITAGDWRGLVVTGDELDRRGGTRVRERAATLGRAFDVVLVRGLRANDLKVGWPLHRLQRLRDERLLRYVVIDTDDALEAEWIAANAPVHGVAARYTPGDMAARYRVFAAAGNAGVALIGRGDTFEAAALQLATDAFAAVLLPPDTTAPASMPADAAEALWSAYAAANAEPPKPRGGHPPDEG